MTDMIAHPSPSATQAAWAAAPGRPAPRFCPTRADAATANACPLMYPSPSQRITIPWAAAGTSPRALTSDRNHNWHRPMERLSTLAGTLTRSSR